MGDTFNRGGQPYEMGSNLTAVDLGLFSNSTLIPDRIFGGELYTCAILSAPAPISLSLGVKCWGFNDLGQLGLGDTESRGDGPGEMGDALPFVELGTGLDVVELTVGGRHACAFLKNGTDAGASACLKCWGWNRFGQLGLNDTTNRGDAAGQMGDALPCVDLAMDDSASAHFSAGFAHTCAGISVGSVPVLKCWGWNDYGQVRMLCACLRLCSVCRMSIIRVVTERAAFGHSSSSSPAIIACRCFRYSS